MHKGADTCVPVNSMRPALVYFSSFPRGPTLTVSTVEHSPETPGIAAMSPGRSPSGPAVGPDRDNGVVTTPNPWPAPADGSVLLNRSSFLDVSSVTSCASHVRRLPRAAGSPAQWPGWTPPGVRDALRTAGIEQPWTHQVAAAQLARDGHDVVLSTGTASGKSLGY